MPLSAFPSPSLAGDLEKMKKARVYSHTTVRISFPDGCTLTGKFLPSERVSDVRDAVASSLASESLRSSSRFDLYVSPPRRALEDGKTLEDEGLVPAAKVHVSWRAAGSPPGGAELSPGSYLRSELFAAEAGTGTGGSDFPDARRIVDDSSGAGKGGGRQEVRRQRWRRNVEGGGSH